MLLQLLCENFTKMHWFRQERDMHAASQLPMANYDSTHLPRRRGLHCLVHQKTMTQVWSDVKDERFYSRLYVAPSLAPYVSTVSHTTALSSALAD